MSDKTKELLNTLLKAKSLKLAMPNLFEKCVGGIDLPVFPPTPGPGPSPNPDPEPEPEPEPGPQEGNPLIFNISTPYPSVPSNPMYIWSINWSYVDKNMSKLPNPLILPSSTKDGLVVKGINMDAFKDQNLGVDVIIPETITDLSKRWIFKDAGITGIKMHNYVTGSIGRDAFNGNYLGEVSIPPLIRDIENGAFENAGINKLNFLGSNVENIKSWAFRDNNLVSLELKEGLKHIYSLAFANNQLISITIPSTLITLQGLENNKFEELTVPGTVDTLDGLSENRYLKYLNIEDGVRTLRGGSLFNTDRLTDVRIPDSIDSLKDTEINRSDKSVNKTINIYANLLEGDTSNEDGSEFTLRGTIFKGRYDIKVQLKPLSEFPTR